MAMEGIAPVVATEAVAPAAIMVVVMEVVEAPAVVAMGAVVAPAVTAVVSVGSNMVAQHARTKSINFP